MFANAGDHIVIHGRYVGAVNRAGTIVDVRGAGGSPPYLVRWDNTQELCLIFPGADAEVHHTGPRAPGTRTRSKRRRTTK